MEICDFSCRGHGQITFSPDCIHLGPGRTSGPTGSTSCPALCFRCRAKCHGQLVGNRYESLSCHPFFPPKKNPKSFWFLDVPGMFFLGGLEQSGVQAGFQEVKFWTFPGHNSAALNDMDHFDVANTGAWDIATRCIPQWARSLQSDFHQSKLHNCIKIFRLNDVLLASCGTVQWSWSFYGIEQKRFAVCGMRVLILHSACVLLVQYAYFKSTSLTWACKFVNLLQPFAFRHQKVLIGFAMRFSYT